MKRFILKGVKGGARQRKGVETSNSGVAEGPHDATNLLNHGRI